MLLTFVFVRIGVLRGERGRFQLFGKYFVADVPQWLIRYLDATGDTVNTAARLESTGEPRKIQVSTETAQRLMAAGKEHWLTKREGKVTAKGKGELEVSGIMIFIFLFGF
jgi:Adenylate and Guanylate cyclase catalytic domain